jgi:hypothetical protein
MKFNACSEKPSVIEVSKREVSFFERNYPVHHAVLMELVKRGEASIIDAPGGKG